MKSGLRRITARLAATTLVGVVAVSGATAAQAWTLGTQLGTATVTPANGGDIDTPTINTPAGCSDPAATNSQLVLYGSGFPSDGYNVSANNPNTILPSGPGGNGYAVATIDSLQNIANAQMPPAVYTGTYTIAFVCKHSFGTADYGDYIATLNFTDPHHYTTGAVAVATTTALTVSPAGSATAGAPVTLTAAVTPAGATGSVQFFDGATSLGTATVAANQAHVTISTLLAGAHSFTAAFTPTAPAGATASTSAAVSYIIAIAAPVISDPSALILSVGTVITCPGGQKLAIPAAQLNNAIYCKAGGAFLLVAKGAAPHALIAPSLSGTGKVGSKLTFKPGLWTPNYSSRTLVWKRDGKVIAQQTAATYVVEKTDKGHKISVTMTAHLAGHLDGTATTPAVGAKALSGTDSTVLSLSTLAKPDSTIGDATPIGIPVGTAIGCFKADFTGATTVTSGWLLDGKPYAAPAVTIIGDKLVGKTLTCRTTATNSGGSTISDAVVKVGPGAKLAAYVKPRIVGVNKVGKKLSAVVGKWYPVYAKAAFVWLRNGVAIKGATKPTYVVTKADKAHKIAVRVTVTRTGWGTGTSTSSAVSIG
jgi:Bacterial Ig-like domain (group 3)